MRTALVTGLALSGLVFLAHAAAFFWLAFWKGVPPLFLLGVGMAVLAVGALAVPLADLLGWWKAYWKKHADGGELPLGPYGSFRSRFRLCHFCWGLSLMRFDEDWHFHAGPLWVRLWKNKSGFLADSDGMLDKWGVEYCPDMRSVYVNWRAWSKFVRMPWDWEHVKKEVLLKDGTWVPHEDYGKPSPGNIVGINPDPPAAYRAVFPYRYLLKSGVLQRRLATVTADRRTWAWRWLTWLGWPRKTRASIDVRFDDEVGERSGSWKGGTIGCGYNLRPGESPEQCLRRMERERTFD